MTDNAALMRRIREGDTTAENEMVEKNMGLVYSIAQRYTSSGTETEDLIQIGAIGLIKAVKKFDESFNVRFSTYAVPVIAGEIKRFLRDDGSIKISRTLKETALKGRRAAEELRRELGREPTVKEIAKKGSLDEELLNEAFEAVAPPASIYDKIYENSDKKICLIDTMASRSEEEKMIDKIVADSILKNLSPRERRIMVLRYYKGKTQTEVAREIGVSQVQVSRLEKQIIKSVRSSFL